MPWWRGFIQYFLIFSLIVALAGCAAPDAQPRQYELRGQILAVRPDANEVLIKHGDIQNFMPGMTMPFKVKDKSLLEGKAAGDLVTAQLMVGAEEAWLGTLAKTGVAPIEEPASIPAASFVSIVKPGDAAPEAMLTDHQGQPLSLASWRGSAVVITFIYVRCPLPQFCPLMDRRYADLQGGIQKDSGLAGRAKLLSVSFDPDADTPAALEAHASKVGADDAVWRFATAPREVVDRFAATFGVNVIRERDGTITHNLRTAVIGPDGRVVSVFDGGEWTVAQVLDELRRAVQRP